MTTKPHLLTLLFISLSAAMATAATRPNVLFVAFDDLRPLIGAYGDKEAITPNLDALANEGVQFNRAYVAYPLCKPSRATMLNGIRFDNQPVNGKWPNHTQLINQQKTWPRVLREAGYWTAARGKVYHGNVPKADNAAWDIPGGRKSDWNKEILSRIVDKGGRPDQLEGYLKDGKGAGALIYVSVDGPDNLLNDGQVSEDVISYIKEQRDADKPFAIACGFSRPHMPWVAPKKYFDMYPEDAGELAYVPEGAEKVVDPAEVSKKNNNKVWNEGVDETTAKRLIRGYMASTTYADAQLGKIIKALKEEGLYENTIIVAWGDHGYHLTDHGLWRKNTAYHVSLRAPLIIKAPGMAGGKEVNQVVGNVDIYPTLMELTGVKKPAEIVFHGKSLVPLLKDPEAAWDNIKFTCAKGRYGLITARYRFTVSESGNSLYDLRNDPHEWANLAGQPEYANLIKTFEEKLENVVWNEATPDLNSSEASWRFLLLADWHSAEKYTQAEKNPNAIADAAAEDVASVKMLKENYGGELILMPGDSNGGHWDTPKFIKKNYPGATAAEAILQAGHLCYSGMIKSFRKGGYSKLIMAVGDHEMGDNPWPAGSAVSRCQPQFREAFAKEFNINPDGGRFRYREPIGKADSRPLGTKYEDTSYAYRHKNVLFVTVDAFHQEDPDKTIGAEGSVTGTVTGAHLQWLEEVLSEARKDAGIKHILVQSHLPVIYPVRKVNSSGMMMDDGVENPFWEILRKYKIDIYFAGEVHANTVTKDPESDVIQLVSRGNFFNNFQTLDITDDRIEVVCYDQKIGTRVADGDYSVSGRLVIDKSGVSPRIEGEGELAVLDPAARILHFDFEQKIPLASNPIVGLSGREKKEDVKTLRGVTCKELLPNGGAFGKHYSALTANVELKEGVHGRAGEFGADSRMGVFGMGPLHSNYAVSYALWIKTDAVERQMLINTGSIWGNQLKNFFNLNLNNGVPEVMISDKQWLSAEACQLNDGKWHHVAVSMPSDGCLLSEVLVYVDGKQMETRVTGADKNLFFNQAVRLGIGGLNYSNKAFDQLPVEPFVGAMDEVFIWARSLTPDDIQAAMN